ncbi:MAG: amidohydrolase [Lysinibacillus sp.]
MQTIAQADIIIYNANVITLNEQQPTASGIAIKNGKIVALLQENEHLLIGGKRINANKQTILPSFIDAHCHLNAMLANAFAISCPKHIDTFDQFILFIKQQIAHIPAGQWIRINKFIPNQFQERRLLTKAELDQISSLHPIRVRHISRHVTILNSNALKLAQIDEHFIAPQGMNIDWQTGILYGADAWLNTNVLQPYSKQQLMQQVPILQQELLSYGITLVHDATPTTGAEDIQFWEEARQLGWPIQLQFMTSMEKYKLLQHTLQQLKSPIQVHTIKVVMESLPELYPTTEQLQEIVNFSLRQKIPLAVHAVTPEMVWSVINALSNTGQNSSFKKPLIRLEHVSLCPEAFIPSLAGAKLCIVSNPTFIYEHGDRYLEDVPKDEHNWLYLIKSLQQAIIPVAAGSDAPVASANPFIGMYAACTRATSTGQLVNSVEKISRLEALKLYTTNAAISTDTESYKGQLAPGFDADFLFVDLNPLSCPIEKLPFIRVMSTWIHGQCVYKQN